MEDGKIMNKDEIKKIQDNLDATLAVEGLKASKKCKTINKRFLVGKISAETARKMIINYHLNKGGVNNG